MTRNFFSALLLIFTIIAAAICYILVFKRFDTIWFNFNAIFYLAMITFGAASLIFVSAIMIEIPEVNTHSTTTTITTTTTNSN